jgi:ABC-type multidrug transport system permease subunit
MLKCVLMFHKTCMLMLFLCLADGLPTWWSWGYWLSPLTYAQNAISVNELLAPEWDHVCSSHPLSPDPACTAL